ncbi:MAG TPA: hypothetical protein VJC17_00205 [Candidatus Dojkabacteria bacterium]|nr:hypothetical protein [Candidatus Dojkabacteria bacterium]
MQDNAILNQTTNQQAADSSKAQALRERVQSAIVKVITDQLEKGEMTEERAKQIAQIVLEQLPENISYQKLIEIIPKLDDHFSELTVAIVPIMVEYEEKMKQVVNKKISELMQAHKLEEALEVTKKAIEFEKQLT